ncbi:SOS response-associated peptidase (plasmid) [Nitrobacteraceae bacterium UC4446_H13]
MCNLYSMTRSQDAVRRLFKVTKDSAGNLLPLPSIFPDGVAPVIRSAPGGRQLITMRWGFSPPIQGRPLVTNVRNVANSFWRPWLKPANRCLVPVTSFSEDAPEENPETGKKDIVWFSIDETRPLFAFAGLWRPWSGPRGTKAMPVEGDHLFYSFLTSRPNAVVAPFHPKEMPIILHKDDWEKWLTAEPDVALKLQRSWPDSELQIVARGPLKSDQR